MTQTNLKDPRTLLLTMLTYRRPHGSASERRFINRFIKPTGAKPDRHGNWVKIVGDNPTILFSSHTDSVHRKSGRQKLCYLSEERNLVGLLDDKGSNCLGADCAVGVWLMLEMIHAGIPGVYVFHREEESGGIGSAALVDDKPEFLTTIKAVIAFDRRGKGSVITHQFGQRCCSDEFGTSLRQIIGPYVGDTVLDTGGTFTDSANYTDVVGECTNLSVGFNQEHTKWETLDLDYALAMRTAMLNADWASLVFKRRPGEFEATRRGGYRTFSGAHYYDRDEWDSAYGYGSYESALGNHYSSYGESKPNKDDWYSLLGMVKSYPESAADLLESLGITPSDFRSHIAPWEDDREAA